MILLRSSITFSSLFWFVFFQDFLSFLSFSLTKFFFFLLFFFILFHFVSLLHITFSSSALLIRCRCPLLRLLVEKKKNFLHLNELKKSQKECVCFVFLFLSFFHYFFFFFSSFSFVVDILVILRCVSFVSVPYF